MVQHRVRSFIDYSTGREGSLNQRRACFRRRKTTMEGEYEKYLEEYNGYLARVRTFLASTRTVSTLKEAKRLTNEARRCATAMQGLAEVEGDASKVAEAKRRIEQEVRPLSEEVFRALRGGSSATSTSNTSKASKTSTSSNDGLRQELFGGGSARSGDSGADASSGGYRPPTLDGDDIDVEEGNGTNMILESERLLLESQALCSDSEQVGASTLQTMGQQRDQLHNATYHLQRARTSAEQARQILKQMSNRALRNKLFLYGVIAALVLANGAVLYRIFTK